MSSGNCTDRYPRDVSESVSTCGERNERSHNLCFPDLFKVDPCSQHGLGLQPGISFSYVCTLSRSLHSR